MEKTVSDTNCIFSDIPVEEQSLNCRAKNLRRLVYEQIWLKWNDEEFIKTLPVDDYIPTANVSHYLSWIQLIIDMFDGTDYQQKSVLEKIKEFEKKYPDQNNVPRPPHWSGWRILPAEIEFWVDGEGRIHERLNYKSKNGKWEKELLYP